jgi:hypothetical protein
MADLAAVAAALRNRAATPDGIKARTADLLATIHQHDQAGDPHEWETCFIAVCEVADALADAIQRRPRTWSLPAEPGPEVTAVADTNDGGRIWLRHTTTTGESWWYPRGSKAEEDGTDWEELVAVAWPGKLTDATPADGQDPA